MFRLEMLVLAVWLVRLVQLVLAAQEARPRLVAALRVRPSQAVRLAPVVLRWLLPPAVVLPVARPMPQRAEVRAKASRWKVAAAVVG